MPAPSPEFPSSGQAPGSDYFPTSDFLESPNLATELTGIVDADMAAADALNRLDLRVFEPSITQGRLDQEQKLHSANFYAKLFSRRDSSARRAGEDLFSEEKQPWH